MLWSELWHCDKMQISELLLLHSAGKVFVPSAYLLYEGVETVGWKWGPWLLFWGILFCRELASPSASGMAVRKPFGGNPETWNSREGTWMKDDVKEKYLEGTFFPLFFLSPNHWKTAVRESQWQETSFPRRASQNLPLGKAALAPPTSLWGSATKCIFLKGGD